MAGGPAFSGAGRRRRNYIIADAVVAPFADTAFYSEKIVHLPHSFWPFDAARPIPPAGPSRTECALPETGFVFCSFSQFAKITAETFAAWMRLLVAMPGAVLWLREGPEPGMQRLREQAGACGVDPARLIWAKRMDPYEQHLARHANADLFLDTFPYGGHVTCSDALWAGLPVVTRRGATFASRVAASFLHCLDLRELITDSAAEYEALALALAKDPARLAAIRARLAANRLSKPLFNAPGFARGLEAAYQEMTAIARRGQAPHAFAVAPP
jgi:protein O-GlcNAc transferase